MPKQMENGVTFYGTEELSRLFFGGAEVKCGKYGVFVGKPTSKVEPIKCVVCHYEIDPAEAGEVCPNCGAPLK